LALSSASLERDLDTLYRSNAGWMFARACRFSDSSRDAEEAVQETFARFFERANPATIANVPAYLTRTLDNVIRARRRGAARFERTADPSDSCFENRLQVLNLEHSEIRQDINAAMMRLKPRHRRVLTLLSEGVPPREIGQILGVNGQAARALLVRARSNARKLLRDDYLSVVIPCWLLRINARLRSFLAQLNLPFESAIVSALVVGTIVSGAPSNRSVIFHVPSIGIKSPALSDTFTINLVASQISPAPVTKQSGKPEVPSAGTANQLVARVEAPGTTVDRYHSDDTGDPEPSLFDQLVQFIENPGSLPTPECGGVISCPSAH
jgi:RNA polymerase sigma-70 factor, ECF subfamily